ncbi:MAG: diaminopimelate epimerase [Deltaproteobacteria bacterium]|nr:diaminopimelate epimerase [Deltaproteobacteria bacterium]
MSARSVPFYKLSPGGNPTILVRDDNLLSFGTTAQERAAIARAFMDPDILGAEQVGFLDTSRPLPHMEMMGGEFCVNAIRSAALVFAMLGLLPQTPVSGHYEGTITASGTVDPVRVRVRISSVKTGTPATEGDAAVAVSFASAAPKDLVREYPNGETLVHLPGITHLLLDAARHPLPESPLAAAAAKRKEHGLENREAAGVIWYAPAPDGAVSITPVVHVAATGSSVAETACGSGSLALALLLARSGTTNIAVRQPSGHDIRVSFEQPATPSSPLTAWIDGIVRLTADGTAHLPF